MKKLSLPPGSIGGSATVAKKGLIVTSPVSQPKRVAVAKKPDPNFNPQIAKWRV